jgi:hypothetical protein
MKTGIQAAIAADFGLVLFSVLLFLPAGTVDYWQAWVFIANVHGVDSCAQPLPRHAQPEVLQRRLNAGPRADTRPAQKVASVGFIAVLVS